MLVYMALAIWATRRRGRGPVYTQGPTCTIAWIVQRDYDLHVGMDCISLQALAKHDTVSGASEMFGVTALRREFDPQP